MAEFKPVTESYYENDGTVSSTAVEAPTYVDDGSDPYFSNGQSTIAPADPPKVVSYDEFGNPIYATKSTPVDDGSDPYFSNGQSTIAPAEPPKVVSYDEFGNPIYETTSTPVDDGSDPYFSNGVSTVPPYKDQKTVEVVSVQRFDDGSYIETLADGTTVSHNAPEDTDSSVNQIAGAGPEIGTTSQKNQNPKAAAREAKDAPSTQDVANFAAAPDWRFRIKLAPSSNYLYNAQDAGILAPLKKTNGVLFPYVPQITVGYTAAYDPTDLVHTNYKFHTYRNSSVEQVSITADFTAQNITEASYVMAVIHFFRSATKMFYGQDANPVRGTPPPLVYLSGFGAHHFDNQAGVVTSFNFTYPNDVDYISTGQLATGATNVGGPRSVIPALSGVEKLFRMFSSGLQPGAKPNPPSWSNSTASVIKKVDDDRIPTKLTMSINILPIVTRYDVSNSFSLKDYASGKLMQGSKRGGGGMW